MATKKTAPGQMTVLKETGVTLQEDSFLPDQGAPLAQVIIRQPDPVMPGAELVLNQVKSFAVTDKSTYEQLAHVRANIVARWNQLEADRKELKEPSLEAGRRVDRFFNPALVALANAKELATAKLTAYDAEQRRIAAEKQRLADLEAQKERDRLAEQARQERERAAAEQRERERLAAEAKLAEEKAQREAAEARAREEQAKRIAADAAAKGDREAAAAARKQAGEERAAAVAARAAQMRAEEAREAAQQENVRLQAQADARATQLEEQAEAVAAPIVKAELADVPGLSRTKTYGWKLVDKSKVKVEYLILDEKAINALVRSAKERAAEIVGGIQVFENSNLAQR